MPDLSRAIYDALLPQGSIWTPKSGGSFDDLLDGLSSNSGEMIDFISSLAHVRDPYKTPMLADMEKEYGIRPSSRKTEIERREGLHAAISDTTSDGSISTLQAKLDQAGFNILVHENEPAANPTLFIEEAFSTVFNNENAIFYRSDSFFGFGAAGELLVNGDQYPYEGDFVIPADSGYWPLFFFVGGKAYRNVTTGALEQIAVARVSVARRDEIKRIILKYKPMHTWCGLIVEFI